MATELPPPYPGFRPELAGGHPYSQQLPIPGERYPAIPMAYPTQQVQPYPVQQGQPYPVQHGQPYPMQQGQHYPMQQNHPYPQPQGFPKPEYVAGQAYPNVPGNAPENYGAYGQPPTVNTSHMGGDPFKDDLSGWTGFTDKAIRAVFIRKVYLILMVQLLFSLAVISLFVFERNVKLFVRRNIYLYYISYVIFLGVYIALACCGNLRRKYPTNMIMLSIFTISMSYMLGTISSFYDTDVVLMAVGICAGVCLAVSVFSFHTKFDFTSCGGVLFILVWVLFLFGILTIFTYNRIMTTIYAGCGALLFVLFLAYDTQMLMGGKKHELSPEEHIFAAMQIYLDIVYIFMFLLTILGSGKSS